MAEDTPPPEPDPSRYDLDEGRSLLSLGKAYMRKERWEEGRVCFEKALEAGLDADVPPDERGIRYDRPEEADCRLQLGAAFVELGELEQAEVEIERGLVLDPREPAYTARGAVRLMRGNLEGARPDLDRAIELSPDAARPRRHRATYFEKQGDLAAAEADLSHNLAHDASAEPERTRWIELRRQQGKTHDPNQDIPAPTDPVKRYLRGLTFVQRGNFEAAISDYTYAIDHKPEMSELYLHRGIAFDCAGKLEFALSDFQAYELRNPEQPFGAFYQGRTWAKLGNTAEAMSCYERALSISPSDPVGAKKALSELLG